MTASLARSTQCRSSMSSTVVLAAARFSTSAQLASRNGAAARAAAPARPIARSDIGRSSTASRAVRRIWRQARPGVVTLPADRPPSPSIERSRPFSAANGALCKFGLHSASIRRQPSSLKLLDELMHQPRFPDAGIAGQEDGSAAGAGLLGGASQQRRLPGATDESRDVARLAQPPARQVAGAGDPIDRHGLAKTL